MADTELIDGYAQAMFAVARAEDALPAVEDELYAFGKALEQNTALRESLTDAALPAENKKAVVRDLIGERANPVTVSLLGFVIDAGRAARDPEDRRRAGADGVARTASTRWRRSRSAVELTAAQRDRLAQALSHATGRTGRREGRRRPERGRWRRRPCRRRGLRRLDRDPSRGRQTGTRATDNR